MAPRRRPRVRRRRGLRLVLITGVLLAMGVALWWFLASRPGGPPPAELLRRAPEGIRKAPSTPTKPSEELTERERRTLERILEERVTDE